MKKFKKFIILLIWVFSLSHLSALQAQDSDGYEIFLNLVRREDKYTVIVPRNEYQLIHSPLYIGSYIGTYSLDENNGEGNFYKDNGFTFFILDNDHLYKHWEIHEKMEKIESFLRKEGSEHDVRFHDINLSSWTEKVATCDGLISTPTRGVGYFLLKRLKPFDLSTYAAYLIYCSFDEDYDKAQDKFNRIWSYLHEVNDEVSIVFHP